MILLPPLILAIRFMLAACLLAAAPLRAAASPRTEYLAAFEGHLARERKVAELPTLVRSPSLDVVAQAHADDMARRDYFAHESPEGEDAAARVLRLAPRRIVFAVRENLALEAASHPDTIAKRAADAHRCLMESPGHRANILNAESTHIGLGVAAVRRADGKTYEYAVQVFAIEAGGWSGTVLRQLPRRFAGAAFPVALDRSDVDFIVKDLSEPTRPYADPRNGDRQYYGWAPVRLRKGAPALIFPPFEPGEYALHARIPSRGAGYYEVQRFRVE